MGDRKAQACRQALSCQFLSHIKESLSCACHVCRGSMGWRTHSQPSYF
jgi:hypothetical protein